MQFSHGRKAFSLFYYNKTLFMDIPHIYEIRVEGHITDRWSEWFEALVISRLPNGESALTGSIVDQSALFGILTRVHDLNLILISVIRVPRTGEDEIS